MRGGCEQPACNGVRRQRAASCPARKPGADAGAMPAKLSVRLRARVTAGLANDVDAVNQ
jgi:hypothetical protein